MTAIELALAAIDSVVDTSDATQSLIRTKCRALVTGYNARWEHAGYVPLSVERLLISDLVNPDTQKKSRTFRAAGKLDVIAKHSNRLYLIDHKTTSQDIADPNAPYWRQLVVEGQVNHYYLLAWLNGEKFDGAVWDVCRKPSISPKKLTKAERASVVSTGTYFGFQIPAVDRQRLASGEERETLAMYEVRLIHDCTRERPDWYFQRRQVPRMDNEILEYANELWQHGQDVLATRNMTTQEHIPVRNSGACMMYGSPCKFLGICSGRSIGTVSRSDGGVASVRPLGFSFLTDFNCLANIASSFFTDSAASGSVLIPPPPSLAICHFSRVSPSNISCLQ